MHQAKRVPAGHVFFEENAEGSLAFVIISGKVEISKTVADKTIVLAVLGQGEIFGEMALLCTQKRTATARAIGTCEVVSISRAKLLSLFRGTEPFVKALVLALIRRLKAMDDQLCPLTSDNMYASVCHILVLMASALESTSARGDICIPYADALEQIKVILSISASDCSQILERIERLGLIHIDQDDEDHHQIRLAVAKEEFPQQAQRLFAELDDALPGISRQNSQLIDIMDLAAQAGTSPDRIYRKIGAGEVPPELFFFRKRDILEWLDQRGKTFFENPLSNRLGASNVEALEDILLVDDPTLQSVLSGFDVYKLCLLLKNASGKIRQKVYSNLSTRISQIVQQELPLIQHIDADEVEQTEAHLLQQIKTSGQLSA